jgi:hypothetical protein
MYDHKLDLSFQTDTLVFQNDTYYLRVHILANVEIYRECELTYQDAYISHCHGMQPPLLPHRLESRDRHAVLFLSREPQGIVYLSETSRSLYFLFVPANVSSELVTMVSIVSSVSSTVSRPLCTTLDSSSSISSHPSAASFRASILACTAAAALVNRFLSAEVLDISRFLYYLTHTPSFRVCFVLLLSVKLYRRFLSRICFLSLAQIVLTKHIKEN